MINTVRNICGCYFRKTARIAMAVMVTSSVLITCISCSDSSADAPPVPETNYPVDGQTGFQSGGSGMPTFAPVEELETVTPAG